MKTLENIIKQIASENNYTIKQVESVIKTLFRWQKQSINNLEYSEYYYPKFGSFKHIKYKQLNKLKKLKENE